MGRDAKAPKRALPYFMSSTLAAIISFPLWKASAIGQSGFKLRNGSRASLGIYLEALKPPFKGVGVVVFGMTWARAAIFLGSDRGRQYLQGLKVNEVVASILPPFAMSTLVQICNQPIIRASITLQDPSANHKNAFTIMRGIVREHGVLSLWHGTSAGILKTVPKYCTAICVKDYLEDRLPPSDRTRGGEIARSGTKAVLAGMAGAVLTNPFDVVRNEMFKTHQGLLRVVSRLYRDEPGFAARGLAKNVVAVSIPVACTIFFNDYFSSVV